MERPRHLYISLLGKLGLIRTEIACLFFLLTSRSFDSYIYHHGFPTLASGYVHFNFLLGGTPTNILIELIDKCVGSRIWVVMKGDKGKLEFIV